MPPGGVPGPYRLQAELALTHLRAEHTDDTDWRRIVGLYELLLELHPSPVISLNRAIAVGMAEGPAAGLLLLDDLAGHPALQDLHLLPAARADLLARAGRTDEAVLEAERAIALAPTEHERRQLGMWRDVLG
jgi:predicted RNA polymerase sigma factor